MISDSVGTADSSLVELVETLAARGFVKLNQWERT